jgi:hypothetical protein
MSLKPDTACASTSTSRTRHDAESLLFGAPCVISERVLPTYQDVIKYVLFEREQEKNRCRKDPPITQIIILVAQKLISIWEMASIPCVKLEAVKKRLKAYYSKYQAVMKNIKRINVTSFKQKCDDFIGNSKVLFDISCCKYDSFKNCSCSKDKKVPLLEQAFLEDQRSTRKMAIGNIDKIQSKKNIERAVRKSHDHDLDRCLSNQPSTSTVSQISISNDTESAHSTDEGSDSEYEIPSSIKRKESMENVSNPPSKRAKLSHFALACDRTGVSDRAAALITSSILKDLSSVEDGEGKTTTVVVDRSKVRRERTKQRTTLQQEIRSNKLYSIYFDGRKDSTYVVETIEGTGHKKKITEEHISLIEEPGSKYIGHLAMTTGSAEAICNAIVSYLEANNIATDKLAAVGCDGTAVNTGNKGGVIRLLEEKLNRPVHWFVCQLHANELPLRHLINNLDGKTTGPRGFVGPIGKQLDKCEALSVVEFEPIPTNLPSVDRENLSTDQKYLYDIHLSISEGNCSADMACKSPGKMSHARWLTTANRILRLYVSTSEPSDTLKTIVLFIMKVYVPTWFEIKVNSSSQDGVRNIFKTVQSLQKLNQVTKDIVAPVIQRNAYFAHVENILLCMLQDERNHIRELAWRKIKKARRDSKEKSIRTYKIPDLNFEADEYISLINWQHSIVTEPPLTKTFSDDQIDDFIKEQHRLDIPKFPCHTQAVERCIKLVTEASLAVCGEHKRDGYIRSIIESRRQIPSFNTKKDFLPV